MNTATPLLAKLRRFALFSMLAFSFGGFAFYAGIVVPLGSAVLGVTTQGFVTRQVTSALNTAVAITFVLCVCEALIGRAVRKKTTNRTLAGLLLVIGSTCIALMILHAHLNGYLDPSEFSVREAKEFYQYHRLYLWLSTIQWCSSLWMAWIFLDDIPNERKQASTTEASTTQAPTTQG